MVSGNKPTFVHTLKKLVQTMYRYDLHWMAVEWGFNVRHTSLKEF